MEEFHSERFVYLPSAASTQEAFLSRFSSANVESGAVYTFQQTGGRGQGGSVWFGGKDRNIALTFGAFPDFLTIDGLFALDMALSIGALSYVRTYVSDAVLKWPNDLYVGERKLGGVLVGNSIRGKEVCPFYYGIGWNVNQDCFPPYLPNPVSFFQIDGRVRDLHREAASMFGCLETAYREFKALYCIQGPDGCFSYYREKYLSVLLGWAVWRDYFYAGNRMRARIADIDPYGRLVLESDGGRIVIAGIKELGYGFGT